MAIEDRVKDPQATARRLLGVLIHDLEEKLLSIDAYWRGDHDPPYMPDGANDEYHLLAKRSVTNHMPLLVNSAAQVLAVDGYRRGRKVAGVNPTANQTVALRGDLPEWEHWEESRLQARQTSIHKAAVAYGHSFAVTERFADGSVLTRGLSPLRTSALYDDPANDDNPIAALNVQSFPRHTGDKVIPGKALMWDRTFWYEMSFVEKDGGFKFTVDQSKRHGLKGVCPVTRWAAEVDLNGRTTGVIEPVVPIQDRLNQTAFDLLVAQTGSSFRTRWVTGMAPPVRMRLPRNEDGTIDFEADPVPELDADGNPVPLPLNINATKMMFSEDPDVKFGNFEASSLQPYLDAMQQAVKDLASISQTPPHYMLGQIANLSADAMRAAESALTRRAREYKLVFGESWERVFRIALDLLGESGSEDMTGEVLWRDLEAQSLAQAADAYGKLATQLEIPKRALWRRVPGVSQNELYEWEALADEEAALGEFDLPSEADSTLEQEEVTDEQEAPTG